MRVKNQVLNPHQIVKPVSKHILNLEKLIDETAEVYNDKGSRGARVYHKQTGKTEKLHDGITHHAIVYLNHTLTGFGS